MQTADLIIFIIFFTINLIIGIKARGKRQSFRDFAVGSKDFSTGTLVATLVATMASGSTLFNVVENTYNTGLYFALAILIGVPVGLLLTSYVIAPRMKSFLQHLTVADAMGAVYGKGVQSIAALSATLCSVGFIAIQFKVISTILIALFHLQGNTIIYITIFAAAMVTFYSAFGGVKAVTFTDIIQFITFGTLLPALALAIWNNIEEPRNILSSLESNPNFSFKERWKWDAQFTTMLTFIFIFILEKASLAPEFFQRMAMARDIKQVKSSINGANMIFMFILGFMMWIALLLFVANPAMKGSEVITYMIEEHTYVGLKGFLGVGIIALAMSTADSVLNSTAVTVTNDFLPNIKLIKQPSTEVASRSTFVIGAAATILALSIQNILSILLLCATLYMPIITAPILLTIFGFRTSTRVIYIAMGAGIITTVILMLFFPDVNNFFPGIFTNLIFLLGSHYLLGEKGGWGKHAKDASAND